MQQKWRPCSCGLGCNKVFWQTFPSIVAEHRRIPTPPGYVKLRKAWLNTLTQVIFPSLFYPSFLFIFWQASALLGKRSWYVIKLRLLSCSFWLPMFFQLSKSSTSISFAEKCVIVMQFGLTSWFVVNMVSVFFVKGNRISACL